MQALGDKYTLSAIYEAEAVVNFKRCIRIISTGKFLPLTSLHKVDKLRGQGERVRGCPACFK